LLLALEVSPTIVVVAVVVLIRASSLLSVEFVLRIILGLEH
jgi:hypothetical protein